MRHLPSEWELPEARVSSAINIRTQSQTYLGGRRGSVKSPQSPHTLSQACYDAHKQRVMLLPCSLGVCLSLSESTNVSNVYAGCSHSCWLASNIQSYMFNCSPIIQTWELLIITSVLHKVTAQESAALVRWSGVDQNRVRSVEFAGRVSRSTRVCSSARKWVTDGVRLSHSPPKKNGKNHERSKYKKLKFLKD